MPNPYKNKVVYGDETLIDLTSDTVTASDLRVGVTAHSAAGEIIVGTFDPYPVGSIYMSMNNIDPGTLFGGTWERIASRFLYAAEEPEDASLNNAGSTGGEATHTLTVDEMPSHTHTLWYLSNAGNKKFGYHYTNNNTSEESSRNQNSGGIGNTGGGKAHNNMPPYLTVNMWQRTA